MRKARRASEPSRVTELDAVLRVKDVASQSLVSLLQRFGLRIEHLQLSQSIPGSYWGESEAGLVGHVLYIRDDTPIHSLLHEACHYICMDESRRVQLDRDAGGEYDEENAVCYLQSLLADFIPDMNRERMQRDMDAWGYTFRLGSAQAWFEQDADDARAWLQRQGLIDQLQITFRVRQ
jgi:hypothetical protein